MLLPGRSTDQQWRLDYYPDQLDSYFRGKRRLWKITDPTGKSIEITRYDALGRPQRVEACPTREMLLWQETEWNTLGLPTTIRWSDGSSITLGWSQGAPAYVQDAAGRWAWFGYEDQRGAHLLSRIVLGGQTLASFGYDDYGRLVRVAGGNGIGVTYGYDDQQANDPVGERDVLRWIHYDGAPAPERFTYRCCGELESWTKPDGRSVFFDYEAGLLKYIRLGGANANPSYVFSYDLAGRPKGAQLRNPLTNSPLTLHSWVYEYELGRFTGRLAQENNFLAPANLSYTHSYTYYPDGAVEDATLQIPRPTSSARSATSMTRQGVWKRFDIMASRWPLTTTTARGVLSARPSSHWARTTPSRRQSHMPTLNRWVR